MVTFKNIKLSSLQASISFAGIKAGILIKELKKNIIQCD